MRHIRFRRVTYIMAAVFLNVSVTAAEEEIARPEQLVTLSQATLEHFIADPNMTWFRNNVSSAKAIFIVPELLKAGFWFGGSGGSGALLARDSKTGNWSYPAFYTMGNVTFGLQIGAELSEVVLMVMTEKGLDSMLSTSVNLGADASVAAGPVGAGAKVATADILAFSRSKGIFAGLTVEGAAIAVRDKWNHAYYGKAVTPVDILVRRSVSNEQADALRSLVGKAAGGS